MGVAFEQQVLAERETLFAEVVDTFTFNLPVLDVRMAEKPQGRGTDRSRQNRMSKTRPGHNLPRSGAVLEIDTYIPGAMQDTATGALPATNWAHLMMVAALGGGDATAVGGVAGATATASSMPSATGTRVRGSTIHVGQQLDGRANGQAAVIGNPNTSLLTALPATPNAGDVLRANLMSYLDSDNDPDSWRFKVLFRDTGMQFSFHGCSSLPPTFRFEDGAAPIMTLRWMCAYHREVETDIDAAGDPLACDPSIMAGGSNFLQVMGTATRVLEDRISSIEVNLSGTLIPQLGQGGRFGNLQHIVGWKRSKGSAEEPIGTLRLTMPPPVTGYSDGFIASFDSGDGSDAISYHFLATFSPGDGTAGGEGRKVAMYLPKIYLLERPMEANVNQLNYQTVTFGITDGPDTTTALTKSPLRIGQG